MSSAPAGEAPSSGLAPPSKRRRGGPEPLAALAGLPEEEKRKRLIALLQADLAGSGDRVDKAWRMPELTADGRTADAGPGFSFDYRIAHVSLSGAGWEDLTKACRMVFALDGSSWWPCGAEPRCLAESVARAVFEQHARGAAFDPARSGAEWWAQVRQSGHPEEAIQFHWDTDEAAVEQRGVNVHPHISTVTYLTHCGAPTLVVDRRNSLRPDDAASVRGPIRSGLLSYPQQGKHVAFDGQLLHGTVPRAVAEDGERVTFLVNVWLNHRPSGCRRVPKALARRCGAAGAGVALQEVAAPAAEEVAGAADDQLEVTFSRREGDASAARHRLLVPLPPPPATPGATQLPRWPEASGAGLWAAEPCDRGPAGLSSAPA